jgi:hypothetical protein
MSAASLIGKNTFCIFDVKSNVWKEKQLSIEALNSTDTQKLQDHLIGNTTKEGRKVLMGIIKNIFTDICGNAKKGQYLKSTISTIKMVISTITLSPILSVYMAVNIYQIITNLYHKRLKIKKLIILEHTQGQKLQSGINQKRVENGTENTLKNRYTEKKEKSNVLNVGKYLQQLLKRKQNSALEDARTDTELGETENLANGMLTGLVKYAVKLLVFINGQNNRLAPENAQQRKEDVYDITVEGEHEFFANNILVHNCSDTDDYFLIQYFNREFLLYQRGGRETKMVVGKHSVGY